MSASRLVTRRALLAGAVATSQICFPRFAAGAAEFTYKLGTAATTNDPLTARILEAAVRIKRESNGRFELQVFPNAVLGADQEVISQVRLGALEFFQSAHAGLSNVVPAAGLDTLPFIFSSHEEAWKALDGAMGRHIRGEMSKAGLYALDKSWDSSFRQMENNIRPIHVPDDLRGMKFRVVPGPVYVAMMRAFGANPTPVSIGNVYTSLQTHLVDGADLPWSAMILMKFVEVLKYGSTTNHAFTALSIIANSGAMQRLPKDVRDLVERNLNDAAMLERDDKRREDSMFLTQMQKQSFVFNPADHNAFRDFVAKAGLYKQWRTSFGDESWTAIEKSVGPL